MRSIVVITTILVISLALPLGLLLTGSLSLGPLSEPKQSNIQEAVNVPKEPIREQLQAVPEPKQSVVAEAPKHNASIKPPPDQVAISPPPKLPEAQLPPLQQQPVQLPQAVTPKLNIREGVPSNHVLKVSSVRIWVALGNEGANAVRANLTDDMLAQYPAVKEGMINLYSPTQAWLRGEYPSIRQPSADFKFNEQQLNEFIQLVNPPASYNEPNRFENRVVREYGSVVVYEGSRYLLLIGVLWENP